MLPFVGLLNFISRIKIIVIIALISTLAVPIVTESSRHSND